MKTGTTCPKCFSARIVDVQAPPHVVVGPGTLPDGRAYRAVRITYRRCEACGQTFTSREPCDDGAEPAAGPPRATVPPKKAAAAGSRSGNRRR